jgi:hypothetical protein
VWGRHEEEKADLQGSMELGRITTMARQGRVGGSTGAGVRGWGSMSAGVRGGAGHREVDSGAALVRWKLGAAALPQWKLWAAKATVTAIEKAMVATMEGKVTAVHRQISVA